MLVKIVATSVQQLQNWVKEWQDIEEIINLIYIHNTNPPKHHINSMKSFDEFGVENCKMVLRKNAHAKTESNSKTEGEYIENDKSRLSGCFVGRTWMEYYDATGEHHLEETKGRQIFK